MARQQPIELFMPPNMLKAKAGGGPGGVDMSALKRAEAAVETLSTQFTAMMADDARSLAAARNAWAATPGPETRSALLRAAHDIKGQAATFGYPLIARVAASLARLLGEAPGLVATTLVDAHVNAVQVIHRSGIRDTDNAMAKTLCAELDARVNEVLAAG